ncbi:MAG: hypothetical protein ACOWWR_13805 [Eubacteriales bacterium]
MKILIILLIVVAYIDLRYQLNKSNIKKVVLYFTMVALILIIKFYVDQPGYTSIAEFALNYFNQ